MKYSVHIKDIGKIVINKSKRSKRMRITMKPFHPINISIPNGTSLTSAKQFALSNKDWILKNRSKMATEEDKITFFTPDSKFNTKFREVKLLPVLTDDRFELELKPKTAIIRYQKNADINDINFQNTIRKGIEETLRSEAKQYIPGRVHELANINNLNVNKISVRKAKTRWGSCSSQNNISLNIHLMRLPYELIDYVILHELAHTKEKNHSKFFWAFLNSICDNAKIKNENLKKYSPLIW